MKNLLLLLLSTILLIPVGYGQNFNVTFEVDMNQYTGTFTTPEVNGTFNSWCGNCNVMADPDTNGIWTATLSLAAGTYEFKFSHDNWGGQENLTQGSPCTVTNSGFTNRSLVVSKDTTLAVVCWDDCAACGAAPPPKTQIDLPINWDDTTIDRTVTDFGGNASSVVADPMNANNMVLKSDKTATAQTWAGTTLSTSNGLAKAIPFASGSTIIKAVVYSPDTGIVVKLKAEDHTDPTKSVETDVTTTVANAWDTLTFDFSMHSNGTSAINFSTTYDMLSIFYNFGVDGMTAGLKTYYVDDVIFIGGSPPPPPKAQIELPISWDDTANIDYSTTDFGGNASAHVADPMNASNLVLKSDKTTSAQTWAGTTLSTNNGLAKAIPFAAGSTTIKAVVYSPDTGIVVKLKAEDKTDPTKSVETDVKTMVANAWDTLYFDFSMHSNGTSPIDFGITYDKLSIFYNFGVDGTTAGLKTYYVDDVIFGGPSGPPPPKPDTVNVTFQVDMRNYTGNYTTPEVNGTFNSWCGNCNAMDDSDGDTIWTITLPLTQDSIEYKFSHDNWTGQENLDSTLACTKTSFGFTNRFMHLTADTVLPPVCWEACTTGCKSVTPPPAPDTNNVTFRVDMSEYTGSFTTPEVNGTFNGWCGNCNAMDDSDGDNIWEVTLPITSDTIEYKFSYDTWTGQETLDTNLACTKTTGTFTNRYLTLNGDTTLTAVCWESCDACASAPDGIDESSLYNSVKLYPNPAQNRIYVTGFERARSIAVTDIMGNLIETSGNVEGAWDLALDTFHAGVYLVRVTSENGESVTLRFIKE